jgi:hypothetical protein
MKRQSDPAASCRGKVRFDTATEARKVARRASSRNEDAIRAYRCESCRGWHIGTTAGPRHPWKSPIQIEEQQP